MSPLTDNRFPPFVLQLPSWVTEYINKLPLTFPTVDERMRLIIELSHLNVKYRTGGPFAAGIFDARSNRLIAPGVNLVTSSQASIAHAEIVAMTLGQQAIQHYDFGAENQPPHQLVTSTEPCAMCLGAIPWSGVKSLTCGARDEDARAIGFDEGAKPRDWMELLEARGISVERDIQRNEAISVLQAYAHDGGLIYNGQQKRRNPDSEQEHIGE